MSDPVLVFLTNEADEKEGLGDAGIETFRDAPYGSCAREAGQNSRDANLNNDNPVRMTFDVLQIPAKEIPSINSLSSALDCCGNNASGEKERDFFKNAMGVVGKEKIPVLRIADYNTKGLMGPPSESDSPFNALLKGAGVSKKDSETSGGSFGIGKNASFAVSDLQTVFYSTLYESVGARQLEFAAQGKVKLVSHCDADGKQRRATGYWGLESFRAITDGSLVPEWMQRDSRGTSIFSLGFREATDWAERMACSLVTNFFTAVRAGEMVFEVDSGRININPNTIESLMSEAVILNAAEESGFSAGLEFARDLYSCLVSEATSINILDIPGLGKMRVRILMDKGMPRRVGFIRNGMLITDNLRHFDRPLAKFPNSRDFIALVEPADAEASKLLKSLENPAHDAFSAERIADSVKRGVATKALRKLGDSLREMIKEVTGIQSQASVVLNELGSLFADGGKADSSSSTSSENDPESYTYKAVRRDSPSKSATNSGSGTNGGQSGGHKQSKNEHSVESRHNNQPGSTGDGDQGNTERRKTIELKDVRNRIDIGERGASVRHLFFSSDVSGCVELTIQALGVNAPERLVPIKANFGVIKSDKIVLDVVPDERYSLRVCFDEPYDGPVEVVAVHVENKEVYA